MVLLRALVCDTQIQNNWSEIQNIGTVQFIINKHISRETATSAFNLFFGDLDDIYMKLPADDGLNYASDEYVNLLASNLRSPIETATNFIASKEYQRSGTVTVDTQNIFQEGDLLLYDLRGPDENFLPSKLTTPYKGLHILNSQYKNDITCRHANIETIQVFHADRVRPFYGSLDEATILA